MRNSAGNKIETLPIIEDVSNVGTHVNHCCYIHGCKYGSDDCPVAHDGKPTHDQQYPCEECRSEGEPDGADLNDRLNHKYMVEHDGGSCPHCESSELEAGSYDACGNSIFCPMTCNECGTTWQEQYELKRAGDFTIRNDNNEVIVEGGESNDGN